MAENPIKTLHKTRDQEPGTRNYEQEQQQKAAAASNNFWACGPTSLISLPDAGSCAQSTRLGFGSGMAPWGMQYVFEMGKTEIKCHTENETQF